jgi:lipopolysaccharide transport system permease protein
VTTKEIEGPAGVAASGEDGRPPRADHPTVLRHLALLVARRELLFKLAVRDLKVRYKQSVLGIAWAVAQPFALMLVFSVVFSFFVKIKTPGIPYPVFSYVALVPWTYFVNGLTTGTNSLVANSNLVSKIYFPREISPMAALLAGFVDFLVASLIFAGMLLYYHIGVTLKMLWLPAIVVLQVALMLGITLMLSAANVFFRDGRLLMPFALQIWMYVTPVIYPLTLVPARYRTLFSLNPITGIIDAYRRVTLEGQTPDPGLLAYAAAATCLLLAVAYRVFKSVEMRFADVI